MTNELHLLGGTSTFSAPKKYSTRGKSVKNDSLFSIPFKSASKRRVAHLRLNGVKVTNISPHSPRRSSCSSTSLSVFYVLSILCAFRKPCHAFICDQSSARSESCMIWYSSDMSYHRATVGNKCDLLLLFLTNTRVTSDGGRT